MPEKIRRGVLGNYWRETVQGIEADTSKENEVCVSE